jgi:hypothetical protein
VVEEKKGREGPEDVEGEEEGPDAEKDCAEAGGAEEDRAEEEGADGDENGGGDDEGGEDERGVGERGEEVLDFGEVGEGSDVEGEVHGLEEEEEVSGYGVGDFGEFFGCGEDGSGGVFGFCVIVPAYWGR